MIIYFAGSITGGRDNIDAHQRIIKHLQQYGTVLTEHVGAESLTEIGETEVPDETIHDRDMDWLLSANMVVAEVSTPSLGVGYEIGRAVEYRIPVVCLCQDMTNKKLSPMIAGADGVKVIYYDEIINAFDELQTTLISR